MLSWLAQRRLYPNRTQAVKRKTPSFSDEMHFQSVVLSGQGASNLSTS